MFNKPINVEKLRVRDLKLASYSDIVMIVESLEKESLDKYNTKNSIEIIDTYLSYVEIIKARVDQGEFTKKELKELPKRLMFYQRLNTVRAKLINLKQISYFVISKIEILEQEVNENKKELKQDIETAQKTIQDVQSESLQAVKQIDELQNTLKATQTTLKDASAQTKKLTSTHKQLEKRLDTAEHDIITHVLTLLGVFSAIIITIMSVVITTNSWLNNAGTEGFMIALLIPNLIIVFAVVVLVSTVYAYHGMNFLDDKKRKLQVILFSVFVVLIIVGLAGMLGKVIKEQERVCTATHIRYVIPESEYRLITEPIPGTEDVNQYYNFTVDGENVVFPYNKNLVHDGDLYYCTECRVLE